MQFTPKSEDELQKEGLLPEGQYVGLITEADETTSKAGNPMIKLQIRVYDPNNPEGNPTYVFDYVSDAFKGFAIKLRHLMFAVGLGEQYEKGEVDPVALKDHEVLVDLRVEEDKSGEYPPANKVADYLPMPASAQPNLRVVSKDASSAKSDESSDLPF